MKSTLLLAAAVIAAAVGAGCEKRGQGPNPPTPTTRAIQQQLAAVMAETPSADPSLPDASVALAAADAASAAVAS